MTKNTDKFFPRKLKSREGSYMIREMYSFPVAAVTSYHNLAAFNSRHLFSYSSGGQELEISFTDLKSGCQQDGFLLDVQRGEPTSLTSSASRGHLDSLLVASSSIFKVHLFSLCFCRHIAFSSGSDSSCIPFIRIIAVSLGPSK